LQAERRATATFSSLSAITRHRSDYRSNKLRPTASVYAAPSIGEIRKNQLCPSIQPTRQQEVEEIDALEENHLIEPEVKRLKIPENRLLQTFCGSAFRLILQTT
jgi:hypothetical protein